jgi:hypothetical protein
MNRRVTNMEQAAIGIIATVWTLFFYAMILHVLEGITL